MNLEGRSVYSCTYCQYKTRTFVRILKHYEYVHSRESDFLLLCGVNLCAVQFKSVRCLRRHILHKHKEFAAQHLVQENSTNVNYLGTIGNQDGDDGAPPYQGDELGVNNEPAPLRNLGVLDFNYTKRLASTLLHLRQNLNVGQAACTFVADEIANLLRVNNEQFACRIEDAIQNHVDVGAINVEDLLHEQNRAPSNACDTLATPKRLDQYIKNNLTYIAPVQYILGVENGILHTMQYVSILRTLQSLLKHEDVLAEVLTQRQSCDGIVRDYPDGKYYKTNPFFQTNQPSVHLVLYCDEFTLTNQFRDRGKKYKLFALYFQLANLHPKFRSALDNIHLGLLCKALYLKRYGYQAVLRPLLKDLQSLETQGIEIVFEDRHYHFYGTVVFVAADNLGAHGIGGLYENFSTVLRLCRFCNATKPMLEGSFDERTFQLRTCQSWADQVTAAVQDRQLSQVYGIKDKSPLDNLLHFKVASGLPSDIAHDLLEGIVPSVMQTVLVSFINDGHFTFRQLSETVSAFTYSVIDKSNQIPTLGDTRGTFKIKFTQAQTLCLARLLPLMIGELVPRQNAQWDLYLLMVDVLEAVCTTAFSPADIQYIRGLLEAFNEMCVEVLPHFHVTPKHHYTVHYGTQIENFGPLRYCWTIRFEGKHEQFKQIFRRSKNRINVCKSLAVQHQMHEALLHERRLFLQGDHFTSTGIKSSYIVLLPNVVQDLIQPHLTDKQETVVEASKVEAFGIPYPLGCAVILECKDTDAQYSFGKICYIFLIGGIPYLCCEVLQYMDYDRHYHAYVVEDGTEQYVLRKVSELHDHSSLGLYLISGNRKAIVLKYHVR